MHDHCLFWMEE